MDKKTLFYFVFSLLIFSSGYFVKGLVTKQQKVQPIVNRLNLFEVSDDEMIDIDQIGYFNIEDENGKTLPSDLTKYLVDEIGIPYDYHDVCDEVASYDENDYEFLFQIVDLNIDGTKEYIIMPFRYCDQLVRGASGNGEILVVQNIEGKWNVIGNLDGNAYKVTKRATNGYYDLLVNSHGSAFSGVETIYKWTDVSKTGFQDQYEEVFSKWYRYDRNKE